MPENPELIAAVPTPPDPTKFNASCSLPYGLTAAHVKEAMLAFTNFLGLVNVKLAENGMQRLESFLMPANFSSIVGEFMTANIPNFCPSVAKNTYHNGHPDLVPKGLYPNDAAQHVPEGIEVKASRYLKAWQGHNPEDVWLMVFVFDCNRPNDAQESPKQFRFLKVVGARIEKTDWKFAGRSETSRRTITATITDSGYRKMESNWIYRA